MDYIQGIVKHITFYNETNSYAIVKVSVTETNVKRGLFDDDVDEVMTITGYFPKPLKGEELRFFGALVYHEKYGDQFSAKHYEKVSETNIEGLIDYLSSDLFPGIGEKTAERVVSALGKNTIQKIIDDKDVLESIDKLSDKQKVTLAQELKNHKANEQTLIKLYGYGISSRIAMRILNVYKDDTMTILEDNPYKMIDDIDGIGFERADVIARKLGFEETHPLRIKALIVHLFKTMTLQQGHTVLKKDLFLEAVHYQLNQSETPIDSDIVDTMLSQLIVANVFVIEDDYMTLRFIQRAEQEIASKIKNLIQTTHNIDESNVYALIETFEKQEAMTYTAKQKHAIIESLKHQTVILTGGPGTGKTTVIKGLIHVYHRYHKLQAPSSEVSSLIHLIAPTGRAAKRMQESTGYYATTIHRFLGYAFDGSFQHNKTHQVEGNLFIIDEASMIDVALASQLLQSLPDYAHVIFVGDDAQLPSVGPGQVFKDLIEADIIPKVTLDVIHRQAENSNIIKLAQAIRAGQLPDDLNRQYEDRYIFKESPNQYKRRLKSIIDYLLKENYQLQEDIQVLIPMYKGNQGIDVTNAFIQETYNTHTGPSMTHGERTFKMGDKVLQLTNQIEDGIMNGDQGKVVDIDETAEELTVEFIDNIVTYKSKDLINLTHAYAMSIHKSQGSEYPVVVLPIFPAYTIMLKRKLIYTAITRAKSRIIIFGAIEKLAPAIKTLEDARFTRLKDKLLAQISPQTSLFEPLPLKRETPVHIIDDPTIGFETLGEELNGKTPYDFMDDNH